MRKLSLGVIINEIEKAGFSNVEVDLRSIKELGIRRADNVVGVIKAIKKS